MPSTPDLTLVLDLSACLCLGLVDSGQRVLAQRVKEQGTRGETAHALLDECLAEAGAGIGDISALCVGMGPGSFTGIRVCAALAQGLAFAARLPLYPFSSLAALAVCAPGTLSNQGPGSPDNAGKGVPAAPIVAAIAANAGQYFVRHSMAQENPRPGPASAPIASAWDREALLGRDALAVLGHPGSVLITSGKVPDQGLLPPLFGRWARFETAVDLGRIARMALAAEPVRDGVLKPNYLMASAAEDKRRAQAADPGRPAAGETLP